MWDNPRVELDPAVDNTGTARGQKKAVTVAAKSGLRGIPLRPHPSDRVG